MRAWILAALLGIATIAVHAQVLGFDFVDVDDPVHVTKNPWVQQGLSAEGVAWAFRAQHGGYWIPATWISHMLDTELFGLDASGHHATNLLLHATNVVLLFALLVRTTGRPGPSALAAALLALHPLHVESFAWVTERKDVLSTCFGLLAILGWVRFVERRSAVSMASTLLCYTLSLLSKPMLVTLPALLLLLDFWPLGRTARRPLRELVIEKLPLAAVALGVAWLALQTQAAGGAMDPSATLSFDRRIAHALVSPVLYLGKLLWPVDLSVVYPHPELFGTPWSAVQVVLASLLLIALSAAAVAFRRRGQLLMGWFWFLISLAPVVGLVQVGVQGMADRFMYVPAMGLYVAVAFTGFDLARAERPALRMALAALAAAALVACAVASARQATYWRDSESLYLQALRATPDNPLVGAYYGHWLESEGRSAEALEHYRRMTRYDASASAGYLNSARLLMRRGLADEAIEQLRTATGLVPEEPEAWIQLASVFLTHPNPERRDPAAALAAAGRAVALPRGQSAAALEVLSAAQSAAGLGADAIRSARRALVLAETEGQHQRARVLRQRLHALGVAVSPGD